MTGQSRPTVDSSYGFGPVRPSQLAVQADGAKPVTTAVVVRNLPVESFVRAATRFL